MEFKIENDHTDEILSALAENKEKILEAIGLQAEANAKVEVTKAVYDQPESKSGYVRTGALRNSIGHASDSEAAYVGSNIFYAPYVEFGTSKMEPRPFIRPAVENYMDEYKQIIEDVLKG